ncbi:MAG: hypothetical protein JSS20_08150, partial [Proteobacteria bacterium]|nr:hypothetical protein [Pseudomonadota bacterium]
LVEIRDLCLVMPQGPVRDTAINYLIPRHYLEHYGIAALDAPSRLAAGRA